MPPCPFCASDLPVGSYYCKRCNRNLGAPVESFPADAANRFQAQTPTESANSPVAAPALKLVLEGRSGKSVLVDGDVVRITKAAGLLSTKREKTMPIGSITSVEVKEPGAFVGFIQFSIAGGKARDSSYTFTGGSVDAVKDENSVVFTGQDKYRTALKIKKLVESWKVTQSHPSAPAPSSVADEIRKLKALADEGVLTREEFEAKKRQLLGV